VALVSDIAVDFASTYAAAFRRYLDDAGEGALEAAYELGRTALREHLTLLDLAAVHHRVLLRALADEQAAGDAASVAESAGRFFLESLSVFEMTQRGLTETRRLYEREHRIAETLQRALLPDRLPDGPDVELCARYLPGGSGSDVGGDWYDAVVLPDGRMALAVGDVSGRGLAAAAVMGQLRMALRAYAVEGRDPAVAMAALDRFALDLSDDRIATALLLLLDPRTGAFDVVNAGHPPALVVDGAGGAAYVEGVPGPPLGVGGGGYGAARADLPVGATLVLFTDGLVEQRDRPLADGFARLLALARAVGPDIERSCDALLDGMLGAAAADDVALLLARRR